MNVVRVTIVLLAVAGAGLSCRQSPATGAAPSAEGTVAPSDRPESRLHHPSDHPLREVPILRGRPGEMPLQVRAGNALPGGCTGSPDGSTTAKVCDRCRWWKTDGMKYWQPLPKEFGELAGKTGG
jgi:hypothetical protein